MRVTGSLAALALLPALAAGQPGPESPLPPADRTPQLVVRHAGPHAPVTSLAFGPDGTLYAGGFGKVVHRFTPAAGKFAAAEPIRVPVGPGNAGAVNAVAVSPDGKWVAVAGRAPLRGETWTGSDDGVVVETQTFPPLLKRDYGVVYLFDPADPRGGKVIRGQEAGVRALAFATPGPAAGPVLVTAGIEWDKDGKFFGMVRVHDVAGGKELANHRDLPTTPTRPGLAAWAADGTLRVAVAWPPGGAKNPGKLLVWDVTGKADQTLDDGEGNFGLALRPGPDGAPRELVSAAFVNPKGRLMLRPVAAPANGRDVDLTGDKDQFNYPLALAPVGDATAVILLSLPKVGSAAPRTNELRLVAADGTTKARVPLTGVAAGTLPTVAASPDGKWVAVAGFTDDRIEVYDAAALAGPQVLAGAPAGFDKVAFLAGNKLWLGGAADEAPRGGTVFDFAARKAAPAPAAAVLDIAPGTEPLVLARYDPKQPAAKVIIGGQVKTFELREDEVPTAAALLPAAPAWDKTLGPVVAVAHYHRTAFVSLVTLFDATTRRRLLQLSGPALRVNGLAFSGSRPLLAAVGADRTVAVWSLKALAAPFAAIEGITLAERDGKLAVVGVTDASPARAALKAGDVIEAVGGEKGALRPVANYREFTLAVREVPVGGTARVKVAGAAPAAVPVGRGVGQRHPLFDLWVNPTANADGTRDWIGWTPAGPYDANSPAAEARLGWLTATGNPAEPVVFAGADQYRRQYYKTGFLRFLADDADFNSALKRYVAEFPRTSPVLSVLAGGVEERDGVRLLRARAAALDVKLDDPDGVLRLDAAELRWRPAGGDWRVVPFRDGTVALPLAGYEWTRGAHRFEFEVRETAELPPAFTGAAGFQYVPIDPTIAVRVNGADVAPGGTATSATDEIQLGVTAAAAPGEEVVVTATTTGPDGDRPVALPAGKDGRFGPVALKLHPDAKTVVRVTARNAKAEGAFAKYETHAAEFVVWHAPPAPRPVPRVTLGVASPVDAPSGPGRPVVSDAAKVSLSATISAEGMTKVEWDDGDGAWVAGEVPAKGTPATRDVTIKAGGVVKALRVRVTAGGVERTDSVSVVWAALPDADFGPLPVAVRGSRLLAAGPVRAAAGGGPFRVKVLVDSPDAGLPPREFDIRPGEPGTWASDVELMPGDNRLSLAVANEWKQVRVRSREVRHVRPPVVVGVEPIRARDANVGDVLALVVAPAELPPDRLTLDGRPLSVRAHGAAAFGVGTWWLRAEGVPLAAGGALPPGVHVAAGNADGDGDAVEVSVIPIPKAPPPPPPPPPPGIVVTAGKDAAVVSAGAALRTDEPEFTLGLRVTSAVKLTRVAVLRPEEVPGISADKAVAADGGFALTATPTVTLREGVNTFEVVASNGTAAPEFRFSVSYTPPPVRVVIDEIAELVPGAGPRPLPRPAPGAAFAAAGGRVQVKGRVAFSDPAAARAAGFDVVVHGNDVRHLPAEVGPLAPGKAEAPFTALAFLTAKATTIRVEVTHRKQSDPVPQQLADTRVVVESAAPLTQQRLHVLVVAPEEAENRAGAMAREVVLTLNGEFIGSPVGFTEGRFKHRAFATATMYRPLVYSVSRPDLVGQLHAVETRIREQAGDGPNGYVNDVVLVYYQGRDLLGRDGARRVHTTRSLAIPSPTAAEPHAVRLDALPPTSGVRFTVLNVVTQDGAPPAQRVTTGPMLLRYAWQNRESFAELLEFYRVSIGANRSVGSVVDWVREAVEKLDERRRYGAPTDTLTGAVRERPIGGPRP